MSTKRVEPVAVFGGHFLQWMLLVLLLLLLLLLLLHRWAGMVLHWLRLLLGQVLLLLLLLFQTQLPQLPLLPIQLQPSRLHSGVP